MKKENSTNKVPSAEVENEQSRLAPVSGSVFIVTVIDGEKQYVRRLKHGQKGRVSVSMTCSNIGKALDFKNTDRANNILKSLGLGFKIEPQNG